MTKKKSTNWKKLNWQKIIADLRMRGWTQPLLSSHIGVSIPTVHQWEHDPDRVPSPHYAKILRELWESDQAPPNKKRIQRSTRIYPTLDGARRRVKMLDWIMENYNLSKREFAEMLGVHPRTLDNYLDEGNPLIPSDEFLDKLRRLIEKNDHTYAERFHEAARLIFGEHYETGFKNRSLEKKQVLKMMANATDLPKRTLYRMFPPFSEDFKPSRRIVKAFEQVVEASNLKVTKFGKPN